MAPRVANPALIPVKVETKVPPDPMEVAPNEPLPPMRLDVKTTAEGGGSPLGLKFPKASFGVRVISMLEPDETEALEIPSELWSVE